MANKRMFSLSVIDTDKFLEMPPSTQALYFHLAMRADDDGFVASPKKIARMINCGEDDLKILFTKEFVIPFKSGVCVIRDWKINNNTIQADRYKPTIYIKEKEAIRVDENKAYSVMLTECIQDVYSLDTQNRLDQIKIDKSRENILLGAACADSKPEPSPVLSLVLNDKSFHPISQQQIDHWKELYPAVDILQELRKMKGWLESNPAKRKTKRGISAFITSWLSKEQDKGGMNHGYGTASGYPRNNDPEQQPKPKYGNVF